MAKQLFSQNIFIVINPIFEEADENSDSDNGERQSKKFSPGLTLLDVEAIQEIVPSVQRISPEVSLNSFVQFKANRMPAKIMGVSPDYFELFNLPLESGTFFTDFQVEHGITVCIIGANIKNKFVSTVNPKARDTSAKPIPKLGMPAANKALPQPPKTSQNVPKNSANSFFISI